MSDPHDAHPSTPAPGAHRLGPHVVGQRVVVRRVVRGERGPSGGPALTDVLGTCTAWGGGRCTVVTAEGREVEIATADVVSGKPVPPRPTVRLRVDADTAQRRAVALFPHAETEALDTWTLRHDATVTARRARSVLAVRDLEALDADRAHDAVVAFAAARGTRPVAAVLRGSAPERDLLARGWVAESGDADTVFALAGTAAVRRRLRRTAAPGAVPGSGRAPGEVELEEELEVELEVAGSLATARLGDRAGGVAAVGGDWVGLRGLWVHPAHRRGGLARAVLGTLLGWAVEQGATTAYLQVLGDNTAALALYEDLGFAEHHRYRYLAAPEATPEQTPEQTRLSG